MLHLTTPVSRKTPLDGRLEIPESVAERLLESSQALTVDVQGVAEPVRVEAMPCTCAKASSGGRHVHHFLASESLKSLPAGANVTLAIDVDEGVIGIQLES